MRALLLLLLFAFSFGDSLHKVARINTYTDEASRAYASRNYLQAIAAYTYLADSLHLQDDRIRLNLAHAYFRYGDQENARQHYAPLSQHRNTLIRSIACQQLGTLHAKSKEWTVALELYRKALIANPLNQQARHNYEVVKKYLLLHPEEITREEAEKTSSSAPETGGAGRIGSGDGELGEAERREPQAGGNGQPDTNRGNGQQESPEGPEETESTLGQEEGESLGQNQQVNDPVASPPAGAGAQGGAEAISEKDRQAQTIHQRLRQMNLSPEKAQMLLEALRQAEVQHLQQLPRQSKKPADPSKPDW
jgi:tetratricopeptide (TPR) repeat protein